MTNNPEGWQDQDIDFWMTKESEEMLVQNRVTTPSRVEKRCIKVSVCQQHRDSSSQYRQRQQKQEGSNENCSNE